MRFIAILILSLLPTLVFSKPKVVVTTTMLTEMVQQIAQDDFEVTGLMGPGSDPHLYRLTAGDIHTLLRSDLIVINGLRLEGRLGQTLDTATKRGKTVLAVGEKLPTEHLLSPDDFEGEYDPHIWGDVQLWSQVIPHITLALTQLAPEKKVALESRAQQLTEDLQTLDKQVREVLSRVPEKARILITSHDAFGYFGKAYGFEVRGIQGVSTGSEAGLGDLAALSRLIREKGVKAIFSESSVSPDLIKRLSQDSGATVGAELYSDSMGAPGEIRKADGHSHDTSTYAGMILFNARAIAEGLAPQQD